MSINPVLNSAVQGINRGLTSMAKDAHTIASGSIADTQSSPEVMRALVNLTQDRLQVQMSAKVLEHADKAIGSLLDIKA